MKRLERTKNNFEIKKLKTEKLEMIGSHYFRYYLKLPPLNMKNVIKLLRETVQTLSDLCLISSTFTKIIIRVTKWGYLPGNLPYL